VRLALQKSTVRDFTTADIPTVAEHANNRKVWINLRDRFPHPYREEHARQFIEAMLQSARPTGWAIDVDGAAVGGIGLQMQDDVERVSAEIGYWLGERFWGRGIATEAVRSVTAHAFQEFDLTRIFALPFADNPASIRVLEKAGYVLEGRMPRSAVKDGIIRDQLLFGAYRAVS
jgi:RimJ/RimL family protein N-acetyltransferase